MGQSGPDWGKEKEKVKLRLTFSSTLIRAVDLVEPTKIRAATSPGLTLESAHTLRMNECVYLSCAHLAAVHGKERRGRERWIETERAE